MRKNNISEKKLCSETQKMLSSYHKIKHNSLWLCDDTLIAKTCIALMLMQEKRQTSLILCSSVSTALDYHLIITELIQAFPKVKIMVVTPSSTDGDISGIIEQSLPETIIICASVCLEHFLEVSNLNLGELDLIIVDDAKQIIEDLKYLPDFPIAKISGEKLFLVCNILNPSPLIDENIAHYFGEFSLLPKPSLIIEQAFLIQEDLFKDQDITLNQKSITQPDPVIRAETPKPARMANISFDPEEIVTVSVVADKPQLPQILIEQDTTPYGLMVDRPLKRNLLIQLITTRAWQKVVVVTRTKHAAHRLEEKLFHNKLRARIIHGTLAPIAVEKNLEKFNSAEIRILIVTDNALSLIKYPQLDAVIFFELPDLATAFFERIQYFSTFLENGETISLFCSDEQDWLSNLEVNIGQPFPIKPCQELIDMISKNTHKEYVHPSRNEHVVKDPKDLKNTKREPRDPRRPFIKRDTSINSNTQQKNSRYPQRTEQDRPVRPVNTRPKARPNPNSENYNSNSEQQGIVNENRLPFATNSFEANIARENKRRNRSGFQNKNSGYQDPFSQGLFEQKPQDANSSGVKISQRKRRKIDPDDIGNQ